MKDKFQKIIHKTNLWSPMIGLSIVIAFVIMTLYPYKTLEVNVQPMPVIRETYMVGEKVEYRVDYCRYTEGSAEVSRFIVKHDQSITTGEKRLLGTLTSNFPTGCDLVVASTQPIPENTADGRYFIEVVVKYKINPFRTITNTFVTEDFEIK